MKASNTKATIEQDFIGFVSMWTLFKILDDGTLQEIYQGPTGDRCKAAAKDFNRSEFSSNLRGKFLIRDSGGRDWMKSVDTGSWRMKWVYVKQAVQVMAELMDVLRIARYSRIPKERV